MNKEARGNLITALILVGCSILSFALGKTFFGIAGAAIAVWFVIAYFVGLKK